MADLDSFRTPSRTGRIESICHVLNLDFGFKVGCIGDRTVSRLVDAQAYVFPALKTFTRAASNEDKFRIGIFHHLADAFGWEF
ncbi:hypothetical protein RRF57_000354 [Xylaria bambusicola]|uniref:Uncharacterized protein n=1 Tax=Xylaria bambusicola TaxID=326684 RepID=A0AAN7Z2F9_9PEZI